MGSQGSLPPGIWPEKNCLWGRDLAVFENLPGGRQGSWLRLKLTDTLTKLVRINCHVIKQVQQSWTKEVETILIYE